MAFQLCLVFLCPPSLSNVIYRDTSLPYGFSISSFLCQHLLTTTTHSIPLTLTLCLITSSKMSDLAQSFASQIPHLQTLRAPLHFLFLGKFYIYICLSEYFKTSFTLDDKLHMSRHCVCFY